ncbi:MAG: type II toxin-antitoxin system HicA family toxin [Chitinophagaceae bacterium]|nr:type II toxin-antitoxin system HicA family toxin [Chitinophagaceae bacterium]
MRIPRDISATELIASLKKLGYEVTRQKGSHIRLTTQVNGQHHITVPGHNPVKIGTLSAILSDISRHFGKPKDEIFRAIFG